MGGRKYQPGAPDELPPHMSPGRKQAAGPRFLNVDLEVRSRKNLAPLAAELDRKAVVLHCERVRSAWFRRVESGRSHRGPDATIRALCKVVEGLSEPIKNLWRSADRKAFDIGYETNPDAPVFAATVTPGTLRLVAQLGADLVVTIYPPELPGASPLTATT